ncbi:MAG TPA: hypothetical protein VFF11_08805 [Candidatus Binatia bacterium]|nr:hypothetical protein [Candidatus Binatia bacterium]
MKTPREILLARHQAAAPKLDTIRRSIVEELRNQETKKRSFRETLVASLLGCPNKIWLELVLPCRRIWLGLAAMWALLFIANFAQRDSSNNAVAQAPPPAGMMMAYRDQEKMVDELLAERPKPAVDTRSRNTAPKPRSEASKTVAI